MSEMNVELLRRVQAHIREEPRRLNMETWLDKFESQAEYDEELTNSGLPPCGTVGCIAGWAVSLSELPGHHGNFGTEAAELIGDDEAHNLFFEVYWPSDLKERLAEGDVGSMEYAEVVCAAIDRFIEHPDEFAFEGRRA
jgi:hypothetical protein